MKYLFLCVLLGNNVYSVDLSKFLSKHPILNRMYELQPKLKFKEALDISNEIFKCHKRIGIDKFLLVAIYNQESSLRNNKTNSARGFLNEDSVISIAAELLKLGFIKNPSDVEKFKKRMDKFIVKVDHDFGISQINYRNTLRISYCSNKKRLLSDFEYSIKCSCNILKSLMRGYKNEKNWWTRYHSSNPKLREKYYKAVIRYMKKE